MIRRSFLKSGLALPVAAAVATLPFVAHAQEKENILPELLRVVRQAFTPDPNGHGNTWRNFDVADKFTDADLLAYISISIEWFKGHVGNEEGQRIVTITTHGSLTRVEAPFQHDQDLFWKEAIRWKAVTIGFAALQYNFDKNKWADGMPNPLFARELDPNETLSAAQMSESYLDDFKDEVKWISLGRGGSTFWTGPP